MTRRPNPPLSERIRFHSQTTSHRKSSRGMTVSVCARGVGCLFKSLCTHSTVQWGGMRSWSSAPRAAGRSFLVRPSRDTHGFAPRLPCVQQGRRLRSARTGRRLDLLCSRRTVHTCKRTATPASGLHTSSIWIQLRSISTMKCRSVRRPSRPPVVARSASAISAVADIRDLISLEDVNVLTRAALVIGARRPTAACRCRCRYVHVIARWHFRPIE